MAYKYRLEHTLGTNYINFNTTPDIESGVTAGEIVRIDGEIYQTTGRVFGIICQSTRGSGLIPLGSMFNADIPKGAKTTFSGSFTMPDLSGYNGAARTGKYLFSMSTFSEKAGMIIFNGSPAVYLTYLNYRLAPQILAMNFERCTAGGAWADDGQYLRAMDFRIAKAAQADVGDFSTAQIVCRDQSGTAVRTVNLTAAQLNAALSSTGYTETTPALFAGFVTNLGLNYTVTLTLGDAYDQVTFVDTVVRSFARLHISGAANGGLAVGQFSTATAEKPLFEVAPSHASRLYGGVESIGATAEQCRSSQREMGIQYGTATTNPCKINANSMTPITFARPFAAPPAVFVNITNETGSLNGVKIKCQATAITNSSFSIRAFNTTTTDNRTEPVCWVAIGPMGDSTGADPGLPGPEIIEEDTPYVDDGIARADYIGMMTGVEIPADVGEAQGDPGSTERPGTGEPERSARYGLVKLYYDARVWNERMVRAAAGRWITSAEAEQIVDGNAAG